MLANDRCPGSDLGTGERRFLNGSKRHIRPGNQVNCPPTDGANPDARWPAWRAIEPDGSLLRHYPNVVGQLTSLATFL